MELMRKLLLSLSIEELKNIVIRGNSIYTFVAGQSWTNAEDNANKVGGHLVTINDVEEYKRNNVWSTDNYDANGRDSSLAFVGFNDKDIEGTYSWSSKETTSWNNLTDLINAEWFSQKHHFEGWDYGLVFKDSGWEEIGKDTRYTPYENRGTIVLMDDNAIIYSSYEKEIPGISRI